MSAALEKLRDLKRKALQRGTFEARRSKVALYEAIRSRGANWQGVGPAAHVDWLQRFGGRPTAWVPPEWRTEQPALRTATSRVAAVVHVYYPDLVPQIVEALHSVPVPFDVLVTNASEVELGPKQFEAPNADRIVVLPVRNLGRDIAPMVWLANAGYLDPYDLVLKVHTKASSWREDHPTLEGTGESWRDALLGDLLGSADHVSRILEAFDKDPSIGCVTADGSVVGPEHWGSNEHTLSELLKRIGLKISHDDLEFAAGSMYWIRGFLLQGLRSLAMGPEDFEEESGQIDGTTAHAIERLVGVVTEEAGYGTYTVSAAFEKLERLALPGETKEPFYPRTSRYSPSEPLAPVVRVVPFYLPQFHPAEINDEAWGKGFTEWSNVAQGRPMFAGHVQPLVPSELGFYDLRDDQVRHQQLELERYGGVAGLMYYYYWFSGKRVLNLPIERLLKDASLGQPFCLMWANENWTKAWDGRAEDVLVEQRYDLVGAEQFIEDIMPALRDPRYMRIGGKAILSVYRPAQIPNIGEVVETWRRRAREAGAGELYLLSVDTGKRFDGLEDHYRDFGFDGRMGFPPHGLPWTAHPARGLAVDKMFLGRILSYQATAKSGISAARSLDRGSFPAVMVAFDNTARKKRQADVWYGSNPYTFRRWLDEIAGAIASRPAEQRIVFINAWNEWAESAVLEPTLRWGLTYLQAVRSVVYQ